MMDPAFAPAIEPLLTGDLPALAAVLAAQPELATRRSTCGHPTLLQLVAVDAEHLPDAVGAAQVLVQAGAPLAEPLVAAASTDSREVLRCLLDLGIGVDGELPWRPLDEALYWCHHELAHELLTRGATVRFLSTAAGLGDLPALAACYEDGALRSDAGPIRSPFPDTVPSDRAHDPADLLDHAFVMAVNCGQREAAEWLLGRGARINARPPGFHWRGTALHAATWRGDPGLVDWLLAQGADPSVRDGFVQADALGWARHHGHEGLVARFEGLAKG